MTDPNDARTMNFFEPENGPLAVDWRAPDLTPEQVTRAALGRAIFLNNARIAAGGVTQDRNVEYLKERNQIFYEQMSSSTLQKWWDEGPTGKHWGKFPFSYIALAKAYEEETRRINAKTDWGLLPFAAEVIGYAVVLAASGGFAAPAIALEWNKIKKIGTLADLKDNYNDLKETAHNVEPIATAFHVPELKPEELPAAFVAADQLLNSPSAPLVIAATKVLAAGGDVNAQRGVIILAKVAGERVKNAIPPGQPLLPVNASGAAVVATVIPKTVYHFSVSDLLGVSDVRHQWWHRLLQILHLEATP